MALKNEYNNRALIPVTQPMVERAFKKMFFFSLFVSINLLIRSVTESLEKC